MAKKESPFKGFTDQLLDYKSYVDNNGYHESSNEYYEHYKNDQNEKSKGEKSKKSDTKS